MSASRQRRSTSTPTCRSRNGRLPGPPRQTPRPDATSRPIPSSPSSPVSDYADTSGSPRTTSTSPEPGDSGQAPHNPGGSVMGQRPRVGQAAGPQGRAVLHRAVQWVRLHQRSGAATEDLRRPDTIEIIFDRRVRADTASEFKTKIVARGTEVTVNAFYKHSRIKQYLKDQRALRIETVVNAPGDLGCQRRLANLGELQDRARAVNARLLHTERAGQGCVLANPVFERIAHPTVDAAGRRATAMRFGDSRVHALAGALAVTLCAVTGITNRSLRALMTGLLGVPYTMAQASYDLARLARNGIITRRPHANTYDLTPDGLAFAIFYTKVHDRVLAPLFAAGQPQAPPPLRTALRTIEHHIDERLAHARLPAAA